MLDANNAWSDLPTAMAYMDRYERYDPYWIEEPFSPDEVDLHARLARSIATTVATGEIEAMGAGDFKELLDNGGAEILQTDAAVCGGISRVAAHCGDRVELRCDGRARTGSTTCMCTLSRRHRTPASSSFSPTTRCSISAG